MHIQILMCKHVDVIVFWWINCEMSLVLGQISHACPLLAFTSSHDDEACVAPHGQVLTRGYCSEGMYGVMRQIAVCAYVFAQARARRQAMGSVICRIRARRLRLRLYLTPGSTPLFYRLSINGIFLSLNHNGNDKKNTWCALGDSSYPSVRQIRQWQN